LAVSARPVRAAPEGVARLASASGGLLRGIVMTYLSLVVLIPLAAVAVRSASGGLGAFWRSVTSPEALAAVRLSFVAALLVTVVNLVAGTAIAWVLARDEFPGKSIINALIDLPFALPTIVAGVTLLALYGQSSPLHLNLAYTRAGVCLAMAFETLPFVVRAVQPVLLTLEPDMEEAAHSLGAGQLATFRRVLLPALMPAMLAGAALAFARAVGEFGAVILISGNLPYRTEVAAVHVFNLVQSDDSSGAAAVSVVLLAMSLAVLVVIGIAQRRRTRHAG
jgi:sulfate/thiosulfate transport system permease protein